MRLLEQFWPSLAGGREYHQYRRNIEGCIDRLQSLLLLVSRTLLTKSVKISAFRYTTAISCGKRELWYQRLVYFNEKNARRSLGLADMLVADPSNFPNISSLLGAPS
jgi:hypothetical protein